MTLRPTQTELTGPSRLRPTPFMTATKLAGGDRSKGSGVLCPGGHRTSSTASCAGARVARSLSAIR